jgi:hypothetical protein
VLESTSNDETSKIFLKRRAFMTSNEKTDQQLPVIGGASDGDMAPANSAFGAASVDPTGITPDDVYAVRRLQVHGNEIDALVLVGLSDEEAVRRYMARTG